MPSLLNVAKSIGEQQTAPGLWKTAAVGAPEGAVESNCCQLGRLLCSLVLREGAHAACIPGTRIIGGPRGNVLLAQGIAAGIWRRCQSPSGLNDLKGRIVAVLPTSAHPAAAPCESLTANDICYQH